jgi:hypothetical protein
MLEDRRWRVIVSLPPCSRYPDVGQTEQQAGSFPALPSLRHFIDSGFTIFNFQKKCMYINMCASKRGFLDTKDGHKTLETYQQVNRVYESQRAVCVLVYFSECITLQINHMKFETGLREHLRHWCPVALNITWSWPHTSTWSILQTRAEFFLKKLIIFHIIS